MPVADPAEAAHENGRIHSHGNIVTVGDELVQHQI